MSREVLSAVHDPVRVAAVHASGLIGTPAEEAFDRLARLAGLLLGTPLAFVTVVGEHRYWCKSQVGLPDGTERSGRVRDSFCRYVVDANEAVVVTDARADLRISGIATIAATGVVAYAGFPIHAPTGEVLGSFCVVDTVPRSWNERDLLILGTLAESTTREIALRALLAAEREARADAEAAAEVAELAANSSAALASTLLESRDRIAALARTLQRSLLPPHLPEVPGVEVAAHFVPAGAGDDVVGDFYDVFESGQGAWCVLLGDVSGKGPGAASVTAMARYTLRAAVVNEPQPSRVLAILNAAMLREPPADDRFLTVACSLLRRVEGRFVLSLCSAGHPPPLIRRAGGSVELACPPGMPLGLFEEPTLVDATVELEPGDAIVYFSDGVTEARNGRDEFGLERLRATVREAPADDAAGLVGHVETAVAAFRDGLPRDDTAVLAVLVPRS